MVRYVGHTSATLSWPVFDDDFNVPELREMAPKPEYFYRAPDGEDLLAIYAEIADEIPCPAEAFWGGR
jgi:hypothetical protein